ncbi:MAG: hypothetical protein MJB14_18260 [Spirochaetes bacterium]|nr:hypothetical protein [Spirochaetota bacterium]
MSSFLRIESISQIHELAGLKKPKHPLISLIENTKGKPIKTSPPLLNKPVISSLYSISLKNGNECRIMYGWQSYDSLKVVNKTVDYLMFSGIISLPIY